MGTTRCNVLADKGIPGKLYSATQGIITWADGQPRTSVSTTDKNTVEILRRPAQPGLSYYEIGLKYNTIDYKIDVGPTGFTIFRDGRKKTLFDSDATTPPNPADAVLASLILFYLERQYSTRYGFLFCAPPQP